MDNQIVESTNNHETQTILEIESNSDQINLVGDIMFGLNNESNNESNNLNIVETTFSVNDHIDLDFEESGNVDIDNFAKSNSEDLENMTLKELQQLARDNNVKVKGKKNELIDRIVKVYKNKKNCNIINLSNSKNKLNKIKIKKIIKIIKNENIAY